MAGVKLKVVDPKKVFTKKIYKCLEDYSHFIEIHYGGASSGKSHGCVQKIILKALRKWKHPRKILFLRKVATTVKDSIFEDVIQCLINLGIKELCKINKSTFEITLPNGATLLFKGMDNPEKIKSIKGISDVVMEEASEFTLDDFTQLTLRLREKKHKQRQIFLMFNPVSKANWVYKAFFEKKTKNTIIHHSTYKDNQFLDELTIEAIEELANRNEAYYKIYALGEFATLDKLVFQKWDRRLLDRDKLRNLPSFFGLDYGYVNDPSAFIHCKISDKDKTLYIVEEYVKKGMINPQIAEAIKALGYSKEVITADSAEQKSNEELRVNGISRVRSAKKGKGSILAGIDILLSYNLIVDERCVKTIEELENYCWTKDRKTQEYINKPIDSYNHCIDALRYAIQDKVKLKGKKVKTIKGRI